MAEATRGSNTIRNPVALGTPNLVAARLTPPEERGTPKWAAEAAASYEDLLQTYVRSHGGFCCHNTKTMDVHMGILQKKIMNTDLHFRPQHET